MSKVKQKVMALMLSLAFVLSICGVCAPAVEVSAAESVSVSYRTHLQNYGWQQWVSDGEMSGTSGQAKRLEAINIKLTTSADLGIQYTTHCQNYGWLPWSCNGQMNGTEGEAKRLEAIKIQLTGDDAGDYDVYYRVHAQSYGWMGWAKNGAPAGTAGQSKRLEAIQVVVLPKGSSAPDSNYKNIQSASSVAYRYSTGSETVNVAGASDVNVKYRSHVQSYGWQDWKYNGDMSGTSGESKRLEAINISLTNNLSDGGITYRSHVQGYGWQGWKSNGDMSGTSGESKRLEAIEIKLTGNVSTSYDVYYRVHAESYGWLGWAKNGETAGTSGMSKRMEGIQVVLVKKGAAAPGTTYKGITSAYSESSFTAGSTADDEETAARTLKTKTTTLYEGTTAYATEYSEYDIYGNEIVYTYKSDDSSVYMKNEYDKYNNVVKYYYDCNDYKSEQSLSYVYDKNGNVTSETVNSTLTYYINGDKSNTETQQSTKTHTYKNECDTNGRLVSKKIYEEDGTLGTYFEYKYDGNGNIVEQLYWRSEDKTSGTDEISQYDKNGNITEHTIYDISGTDKSYSFGEEFEYDGYGNVTKYTQYSSDENGNKGNPITSTYENTVDKGGNLTSSSKYS